MGRQVYLNLKNENMWEEGQGESGERVGPVDNTEATKAAQRLLKEVSRRRNLLEIWIY